LAALAADYGYGLARDHPFADGNKCAFLAIGLLLAINGHGLTADQVDAVETILALAEGERDEASLAEWIGANIRRV
jgi:death on curing protein